MAGGKETPRQKMIGLMYLVLMAMLAMNVSKEIINAFVTIDKKMADGNDLTREGISRQVADISGALAEMKSMGTAAPDQIARQEKLVNDVNEIIEMSKEVQNMLVGKASKMIVQSDAAAPSLAKDLGHYDNLEPNEYYFIDGSGYYQLASMSHLGKKDDYDTPTRLFVGDDHTNMAPEGLEIREKLEELRDKLCAKVSNYTEMVGGEEKQWKFTPPSIGMKTNDQADIDAFNEALDKALETVSPKDRDRVRQIYQILTYPEEVHNHEVMAPWLAGLFDHSPIVAAGAMFTSLKGDAQRAEAIAVNLIASKSQKPKFNFNKIDVIPFANKGYINSTDSLEMKVMVAAYDSTQDIKLRYWLGDSTKSSEPLTFEEEAGKGLMMAGSMGTGRHFIYGDIEVEENGAKKWKPWEFDFTVGTPSGVVANKEMNVLYIGYDNKISASGSGFPTVKASCSGCSGWRTDGGEGNYIAEVRSGKTATITVNGVDDEGKSTQIAKQEFRIKRLPSPTPVIVGAGIESSTVKIGKIKQAQTMLAELKGSPLNVEFTVTEFVVSVVKDGEVVEAKCSGNKLSGKAKNLIKGLRKGQKVYFESIKAKGPKGGAEKIPPLIFKVI